MLTRLAVPLLSLLILGCADQAQHGAAEKARVREQAAKEVARICALPELERQAEIDRVQTESGMAIVCPHG
jgi:hypothetical protein